MRAFAATSIFDLTVRKIKIIAARLDGSDAGFGDHLRRVRFGGRIAESGGSRLKLFLFKLAFMHRADP